MLFWLVVVVVYLGIFTFYKAAKESYEQWYYGRLNRKTFERWSWERSRTERR